MSAENQRVLYFNMFMYLFYSLHL